MSAYSIACLAGDGIGPEVMAQASRGLRAAGRLHGFELDEQHVPFGADATMRVGHPFPLATRNTALAADAILAATIDPALLQELEGELDLRAAVMRVRLQGAAVTFIAPVGPDAWEWTLERAIATARASRGQLTFVGSEDGWAADASAAGRDNCLGVTHLSTRSAIRALASTPEVFDVVLSAQPLLVPLAELAWCLDPGRLLAWGRLAGEGPGIFGPSHGNAVDIAGQGVADPSSMLLAASLMLGEGLGERGAAATLSSAVSYVRASDTLRAARTVSMSSELTDAVLARLPQSHSNAEFFTEAV
ncbi:MAG TPA: isocitrate/isopropylmalate family dehydrogenase [Gaiellaceae bacterium]|nr:isocitrate/isopropylmalate family dehydrogenase [Gaiellaceae bacterium]